MTCEPTLEEVRKQVMWLSRQKEQTVQRPLGRNILGVFEGHQGAPVGRDEGREMTPQIMQGLVGHTVKTLAFKACHCIKGLERSHCKET